MLWHSGLKETEMDSIAQTVIANSQGNGDFDISSVATIIAAVQGLVAQKAA